MPDPIPTLAPFILRAWEVNARANELRNVDTGAVVRVEPKVMAVLVCLAAEAGAPVTRDSLMATVWPEVVVSEDALNRAVSKLRRALGDDPTAPRFVETIPTVGYRLVAPVVQPAPADERAPLSDRAATSARRPIGWRVVGLGLAAVAVVALALVPLLRTAPEVSPSVRPLTRAAGAEIHPALAPDGQRIAYAARARGGASFDLMVQSIDGTPLRLTDGPADEVQPVWQRDADALWFLRCAERLVCTIWQVAASGGAPRRLTDETVGRWGLTAATGTLIALVRDSLTGPYRLAALDPETGARRFLTSPPKGTLGDLYPVASPGGQHIAFVRHDAFGEEDLYTLDLNGGAPRRVTTDGRGVRGHAWTADGTALVYIANRGGAEALWRVRVASDEPQAEPARVPIAIAGRLRSPTIAAGRLVLAAQQVETDLVVWDEATGWQPTVTSTAEDTDPALALDGRLAFVSTRSGAPDLYVVTDEVPGRRTEFGGPLVGAVRWSPDGRRLAFEAQVEQQASVYVLDAEGGTPRALTDAAGYDVGPRWSVDGRFVYFASNRPDPMTVDTLTAWALWRVSGGAGHDEEREPERVGPLGSYVGEALPDGRLIYMRQGEPGLWLRPSQTAPEQQLLADLKREDWGNWTIVNAASDPAVVYPRRTDEGVEVRRLRIADESDTLLTTLDALPGRIQALAVSPDGRRLVAAQTVRAESDLVLIEPID